MNGKKPKKDWKKSQAKQIAGAKKWLHHNISPAPGWPSLHQLDTAWV
jgi:hypothetical protein